MQNEMNLNQALSILNNLVENTRALPAEIDAYRQSVLALARFVQENSEQQVEQPVDEPAEKTVEAKESTTKKG